MNYKKAEKILGSPDNYLVEDVMLARGYLLGYEDAREIKPNKTGVWENILIGVANGAIEKNEALGLIRQLKKFSILVEADK